MEFGVGRLWRPVVLDCLRGVGGGGGGGGGGGRGGDGGEEKERNSLPPPLTGWGVGGGYSHPF